MAWKIKKAVRLAFLDWRAPAARRACCDEEVRLNRRYAPGLYLGVVAVTGSVAAPRIGGAGPVLEYVVAMRRFPQHALWTARLAAGELGSADVQGLGHVLAQFHAVAAPCPADAPWGTAACVIARTATDLAELRPLLPDEGPALDALCRWHARAAWGHRRFTWRHAHGAVRECHGDLHCGNLVTLDGAAMPFDGIEFDPALRWIDTMHDLAFAWMDLRFHGRPDLAARLLNAYLHAGGDHGGLCVLRYYTVQRALVRAKVCALAGDAALARRYLLYAHTQAAPARGALLVTHGYSGSGKSTLADGLIEPLGALVLRSDVERRRTVGAQYTSAATRATYAHLLRLARRALAAGLPVVVDAACLQGWQRAAFAALAHARGVPFLLLDVHAPLAALPARLRARAAAGADPSDADEAVLASQLAHAEPLSAAERAGALAVAGGEPCVPLVRQALTRLGWRDAR
ncbi:AAA family ATPase [Pseudoduganella flava]|nr:AAA family ATPase [Pseudoduganella flava]